MSEAIHDPAGTRTTLGRDGGEGIGLTPAQVGMAGLILSEIAFFGTFIVTYLFYVGRSPVGPQPDQVLQVPVLNTACLLSSSITIALAVRALRGGRRGRFLLWWLATIALGGEFLVGTALEWRDLVVNHGLTIATNLFGTTFYSLVGFHALHVTVGLVLLGLVAVLGLRGHVGVRHAERVELLSWYWHFVDAVWVAVFLTVYVVGR